MLHFSNITVVIIIAKTDKRSPRSLLYVGSKRHVLIKDNSSKVVISFDSDYLRCSSQVQ